jgi:hypothetical protein
VKCTRTLPSLAGCDPEDLQPEGGHEGVADHGDQRHAPHHAALGIDAQEPMSLDDAIDLLGAVQGCVESAHERPRIGADGSKRHAPNVAPRPGHIALQPGHAEHDRRSLKRFRQDRVVARQAEESLDEVLAHPRYEFRETARRESIGFGHHDVDPDRGGAGLRDLRHQPGEPGARPGPLSVLSKTLFVDRHDDGRRRMACARRPPLVRVERGEPDEPEPEELGNEDDRQEQSEQRDPERLAATTAEDTNPAPFRPVHRAQAGRLRERFPCRRRPPGSRPAGRRA